MPFARSAIFVRILTGGALLVLVSVWLFYRHAIVPLRERGRESSRKFADVQASLDVARTAIQEINRQEEEAGRAGSELNRSHGAFRAEPALVWFPNKIARHFGRFGIVKSVTRLNTALEEPELPGYQRTYWAVDLPIQEGSRGFPKLLSALGELEEAEPAVRVIDLAIRADPDDSSRRTAVINVTVLVRE